MYRMNAYSEKTSERRSSKPRRGMTKSEAARTFSVSRSSEVLLEAMGQALEALTARDARDFFEHRGYRALDQLL